MSWQVLQDYGSLVCLVIAIVVVLLRYSGRIRWIRGDRTVFIKLIDDIVWSGVNTPVVMTAWPMVIGEELKGPQIVGFPNIRATTLDSWDIEFSNTTPGQSLSFILEIVDPDKLRFAPGRKPNIALRQIIPLMTAETVQSLNLHDLKQLTTLGLKQSIINALNPTVQEWGCRLNELFLGQFDFVGASAKAEQERLEADVERSRIESNALAIAKMVQILGRNGYAQIEVGRMLASAIEAAKPNVISVPGFGQPGLPPLGGMANGGVRNASNGRRD